MEFPAFLDIRPIAHPLQAVVRVPGSKSITNRALLMAALAEGKTCLANALFSDDTLYFAESLRRLGFCVHLDEASCKMTIYGQGGHIPARRATLFVGNAGTAARFLAAFLALGRGEYVLDGDARLRQRPMGDLVAALSQLGAVIGVLDWPGQAAWPPHLPLRITASGLNGGRVAVSGDISSQFLSALLMAAPYTRTPLEISLTTALRSGPYVAMTLSMMADFGVKVSRLDGKRFLVDGGRYRSLPEYSIEADASAASYFFAAPLLLGGSLRVKGISRRSIQGDVAFLEILQEMGGSVIEGPDFVETRCGSSLRGVDVDLGDIPDTAQTLAVLAPFASTPTRIRGIASARLKECDRLAAVCTELSRLGVRVEQQEDGLTIWPCASFRPACVQTYNDHRMAMAFALLGLRVAGVRIENPACVSKTFPDYFAVLETLR
ncbi:MAG: 3-phosphoshikimate 1-carboxyvinyltransferase [Anaerolineales bacterium]